MLAACGGGGDAPPAPLGHDVPASALATAAAFTTWVGGRVPDDGAEPLGLGGLAPPTSDTAEPLPRP